MQHSILWSADSSIPLSPNDYHTELNTIKYITQENCYNLQLIKTLIKKEKPNKLKTDIQEALIEDSKNT